MADELSLKFDIDSGPAVAGVAKVERAVEELSGELKTQLGPAAEAAFTAFEKLSKAEGPRAIQRGILEAEAAMRKFKAAADEAAKAGLKMPAGFGVAMKTMQADIDANYLKLGRLRDQMGDIKTRADSMAQGFQQAASAGGSLDSMLSNLEARGGVAGSFSRIGLAVGGMAAAFQVGMAAGEKLDGMLKSIGINLGKSALDIASWAGVFSKAMEKTGTDPRLIKWLKDLGDAQKDYSALLVPLVSRQNEAVKSYQALGKEIAETERVMKTLGLTWNTAGSGADLLAKQISILTNRIHEATKSGESFSGMAKENAKALDLVQKAVDDGSTSWNALDASLRAALIAHRTMETSVNTLTGGLQSLSAANAAYRQELKDTANAMREMNAEFEKNEAIVRERNAAIDTSKNQEASWTPLFFAVTEATEAQTAALIELLEAHNAYNDVVAKTLDVAKGWSDYLAQLVDAYKSGQLGLLEYKRSLEDFHNQLRTTFIGATGEAKVALESMIATIWKLIETAGQGGTPKADFSASGALNRMFNP